METASLFRFRDMARIYQNAAGGFPATGKPRALWLAAWLEDSLRRHRHLPEINPCKRAEKPKKMPIFFTENAQKKQFIQGTRSLLIDTWMILDE